MAGEDLGPESMAAAEREVIRSLISLEKAGHRTAIELGPHQVWMLVGLCQMGARQFPIGDPQGDYFEALATPLVDYFEDSSAGDLIEAGWRETRAAREQR